jgi:hypothetical protein
VEEVSVSSCDNLEIMSHKHKLYNLPRVLGYLLCVISELLFIQAINCMTVRIHVGLIQYNHF